MDVLWRLLGVVLLAYCMFAHGQDEAARPLTPQEVSRALQIEASSLPELQRPLVERTSTSPFAVQLPNLKDLPAVRENRQMRPEVRLLGAPGLNPPNTPRRAVVTRFDYGTGLAVMTTLEIESGKVLNRRTSAERPVPLDAEEFRRAVRIASEQSPSVREVVGVAGIDRTRFEVLVPVESRPASPRYRHRLVLLWTVEPKRSAKVLVDLTSDQVATED